MPGAGNCRADGFSLRFARQPPGNKLPPQSKNHGAPACTSCDRSFAAACKQFGAGSTLPQNHENGPACAALACALSSALPYQAPLKTTNLENAPSKPSSFKAGLAPDLAKKNLPCLARASAEQLDPISFFKIILLELRLKPLLFQTALS